MVLRRRQRGVALLTALLVVALATTAAVAMVSRQHLDIRRTANLLESEQAYLYTLGVEGWVAELLRQDREDNSVDHLGEPWAETLPPIPIDGGQLSGRAEDPQGRFNLNNLVTPQGQPNALAVERFRRLLRVLELDPDLAGAVIDWIDRDIDPTFPGGAEDDTYLGLETPYRTPNGPMASVSELRLIAGVDSEVYARLAPYVTVLPEPTALNINTVSPEQRELYMMLHDSIGPGEAEQLLEARGEQGFERVEEFLGHPVFAGLEGLSEQGLAVGTGYFMVTSSVQIGRSILTMNSLLRRVGDGPVTTVWRAQGVY